MYQVWRLGYGLISGQKHFKPFSKQSRKLRIVQSALFVLTVVGLIWCNNQDYLFIESVFPIAYVWIKITVFSFSLTLLLFSLFPRKYKLNG